MSHKVDIVDKVNPAELQRLAEHLSNVRNLAYVAVLLKKIAIAYSDDPGTSDLYDERPVSSVPDLNLGDVRLARRLLRWATGSDHIPDHDRQLERRTTMNNPYLPAGASDSDDYSDDYFDLPSVQDEDEEAADEPGAIDDEGDY